MSFMYLFYLILKVFGLVYAHTLSFSTKSEIYWHRVTFHQPWWTFSSCPTVVFAIVLLFMLHDFGIKVSDLKSQLPVTVGIRKLKSIPTTVVWFLRKMLTWSEKFISRTENGFSWLPYKGRFSRLTTYNYHFDMGLRVHTFCAGANKCTKTNFNNKILNFHLTFI